MSDMPTWEQKLEALQALGSISLRMRVPGNWYVSQSGISIGGDGMLRSAFGNGTTPSAAVEDHWNNYTRLPADRYVVIERQGEPRRQVRWNGFMWANAT